MTSLLPLRYASKFAQLEPYGIFIVLALVMYVAQRRKQWKRQSEERNRIDDRQFGRPDQARCRGTGEKIVLEI